MWYLQYGIITARWHCTLTFNQHPAFSRSFFTAGYQTRVTLLTQANTHKWRAACHYSFIRLLVALQNFNVLSDPQISPVRFLVFE